jgi:hypothetical protein
MKRFFCIAGLFLAISATGTLRAAEGHYTRSMFARAVKKESASPRYALVQVRGSGANSVQTVCIPGHALVEAVEIEKEWTFRTNGKGKAAGFAVRHWNSPFTFEKVNALARVHPRYTAMHLAKARARLSSLSKAQLHSQLRGASRRRNPEPQTELQRIYAGRNAPIAYASREAVAHILLEKGASDDRTGHLCLP